MQSESTSEEEKTEFIVTKAIVYGCEMPRTTKNVATSELIRIPVGSRGTVHVKYHNDYGTLIIVAEFDTGVWAWLGQTTYEKVDP